MTLTDGALVLILIAGLIITARWLRTPADPTDQEYDGWPRDDSG